MIRFPIAIGASILAMVVSAQTPPSPAEVETHYAPSENLERIDVAQIDAATTTLDMAAFVLSDVAVIEAMSQAAARGVKIRLYRDANSRNPHGRVAEALATLAAKLWVDGPSRLRTCPPLVGARIALSTLLGVTFYVLPQARWPSHYWLLHSLW